MNNNSKENYYLLKEKIEKSHDFDFNEILEKLNDNIICVGSGSSYATAYLFSKIIRNIFKKNSLVMRPRELLNEQIKDNVSIIIFSYSGTSKDTIYLLNKYSNSFLICGRNIEEFEKKEKIFSYYTGVRYERGSILYENVLIPLTILLKNINNFKDIINYEINNLEYHDSNNVFVSKTINNIAIFGGDFCETACLNFCNKILETGIIKFDYFEKKDFSHGQYIYFLNNKYDNIIYFKQKNVSEYEKKLIDYLQKTKNKIIFVESEFNSYEAEYDLIYKSNKLFNSILISKLENLKINSLNANEQLYKYEGDFS